MAQTYSVSKMLENHCLVENRKKKKRKKKKKKKTQKKTELDKTPRRKRETTLNKDRLS